MNAKNVIYLEEERDCRYVMIDNYDPTGKSGRFGRIDVCPYCLSHGDDWGIGPCWQYNSNTGYCHACDGCFANKQIIKILEIEHSRKLCPSDSNNMIVAKVDCWEPREASLQDRWLMRLINLNLGRLAFKKSKDGQRC